MAPAQPSVAALPAAAPLLGRSSELALIDERLRDGDCRLLTLLGPGGIGKTHLAVGAARAAAPRFADGVWFASLAGDGGAEQGLLAVLATQISALHPGSVPAQDSVIRRFAPLECLLLFDNLEVVAADSARLIQALLQAAPRCKVLATSRVRLGAAREWLLDVGGLDCREPEPARSPAAQLFCRHAQRQRAGFDPAPEAAGIAQLVTQLEGHPLALALAAQWVRSLDCASIAARIHPAPHTLLAADAADDAAPARHASLLRVVEESWALLPAAARQTCRDLSVFDGDFDPVAAHAVCGADAADLQALVDHSWLRCGAARRFGLHPLQRQYAAERLAAEPAARARLAAAHRAHFASLLQGMCEPAGAVLHEAANLAQAFRAACQGADAAVLVPFTEAYVAALAGQGLYAQAVQRLEEALAVPGLAPGWRSLWWLRICEAQFNLGRSIPLAGAFGAALEAAALPALRGGLAARRLGRAARAFSLDARAFAPFEPAAARWREAFALALMRRAQAEFFAGEAAGSLASGMANWYLFGTDDAPDLRAQFFGAMALTAGTIPLHVLARAAVRRARRLAPSPAAGRRAAPAWHLLLLYECGCGRWDGAAAALRQCADLAAAAGLHRSAHEARSVCGKVLLLQGDFAAAQAAFLQVREEARAGGYGMSEHWGLIGAAEAALHTGAPGIEVVQGWLERAAVLMREIEITDPAYVIRAHGLAARVAWRLGDAQGARTAALSGLRAMQRVPFGIVYMLEGIAGVIETLQAIRAQERERGPASREIASACSAALGRLAAMARQFPVFVPRTRLYRGLEAQSRGAPRSAALWLHAAWRRADSLDMRYEAARAAQALAQLEVLPAKRRRQWHEQAARLYRQAGAEHELGRLRAPEERVAPLPLSGPG